MNADKNIKFIFYDKKMSNNASRIRLWLRIKGIGPKNGGVETRWIESESELKSESYTSIVPTKKCPALTIVGSDGQPTITIFESDVIMRYLEDRFPNTVPSLTLDAPEERALVNLMVRMHDIYLASPNCTQPHFSHTQGCMYLTPYPTDYCSKERTMSIEVRAAKVAEIYKQLSWLECQVQLPYLAGNRLSHADCTIFPTILFMEFMLPRVFGWNPIFNTFTELGKWFHNCRENEHFALSHAEILKELRYKEQHNHFDPIIEDVEQHPEFKWKYI